MRSLLVVALCTAFVVSFVVVLNYDTAGIGSQTQTTIASTQGSCPSPGPSCVTLSITSASLRWTNGTDQLGPGGYANLTLGLDPSGGSPITSVKLLVNNTLAETVQGPFEPGVNRVVNLILPATIAITPGRTYLLSVEGFYGDGSQTVWQSLEVTAQ